MGSRSTTAEQEAKRGIGRKPIGHRGHAHTHVGELSLRRLLWASAINVGFATMECIGGIFSNSLALVSDSVHNFADAASIVIAFVATRVALKKPTARFTFGFQRFEILAALCNAVALLVIYAFIFVEACSRLRSHAHVDSRLMLIIAGIGMAAKFISMLILRRPSHGNLNVRAAYLHLLADLLSSLAVILGGFAIQLWHVVWVDSIISFCVGIYILLNTWPIVRECVRILMQAAPRGVNVEEIISFVEQCDGIARVLQAHVWQLAEEEIYFSARIVPSPSFELSKALVVAKQAENAIRQRFNVQHALLALDPLDRSSTNNPTNGDE